MINDICREKMLLRNPCGTDTQGGVRFRTIECTGRILSDAETVAGEFNGTVLSGLNLLLVSPERPASGCRIICRGREYAIKSIKCCFGTGGRILCYRCCTV